ncbi:MAG: Omp28 family outer membrane lipoprotein [Prevotella sp.]|nr:Omp28 family outer membrane lipoprotein [Prevotella sp.]
MNLRAAILPILSALLMLACSTIGEDERLLVVEPSGGNVPADTSTAIVEQRRVLLEDFTGQRCVNCPKAAAEIERLKSAYGGDTLIAVSIHGGELSFAGNASNVGLRTDLGDTYNNYWDVKSWPKGMINRSGTLTDYEEWFTLTHAAVGLPSPVRLSVQASRRADGDIEIATTVEALETVDASLQLWLTESGIVAMQSMPDGTVNREYVHNHVLRAAVNGAWGEPLSIAQGQTATLRHTITPADAWDAARLSIVAFVYGDRQGVLQVTEQNVTIYE